MARKQRMIRYELMQPRFTSLSLSLFLSPSPSVFRMHYFSFYVKRECDPYKFARGGGERGEGGGGGRVRGGRWTKTSVSMRLSIFYT